MKKRAHNFINLIGQRFERLTVVGFFVENGKTFWRARCDCGTEKMFRADHLRRIKSCGCYRRDYPARLDHGRTGTRVHRTWLKMRQRCLNPNDPDYADYGGRGIRICERWDDFCLFFADMGEPLSKMTIDRIDVNGNYSPENCRWATQRQQQNNKRSCRRVTYQGRTQTVMEWSRETGIPYQRLLFRLRAPGWTVEAAFTVPQNVRRGPRNSRW